MNIHSTNIASSLARHFADLDRRLDADEARIERFEELRSDYLKAEDLYDAIGSVDSANRINTAFLLLKMGDSAGALKKLQSILDDAASDYADVKLTQEENEQEEAKALAKARRCGTVPRGYDY